MPATREQTGTKIEYGTITFDAETRVWILKNFIVPEVASYSYNYDNGRELGVKNAPFFVGSELSPVNGFPFTICYDTESVGCIPPTEIEFYK